MSHARSSLLSLIPHSTFVDKLTAPTVTPCTDNPLCIEGKENEPHMKNIRIGLIDPDTPDSAKTRKGPRGENQVLVVRSSQQTAHTSLIRAQFSDEFNRDGRTFYDGDDPYFQAVDIWYGATQDLEVSRHCITRMPAC